MERQQIIEELKKERYAVLGENNLILKKKNLHIYAFGEVVISEISQYLGKVILYDMTNNNRKSMLKLEHFLIDNNIPFQHQRN
jgi:DNA topoisomerase IA